MQGVYFNLTATARQQYEQQGSITALTIARSPTLDGDVKIVTGQSRYGQHCAYGIKQSFTVYRPRGTTA